jgi:hypothetical protein
MPIHFWAIADTHLSFGKPKNMARFGGKWVNHEETIAHHWQALIAPDDVVLLPGDISWASSVPKVIPDLKWLAALPGRKVLLRGNHDHWWKNVSTARAAVEPFGLSLLEGDSIELNGVIICGAMGHIAPGDPYYDSSDKKDRFNRELVRLEAALKHGTERRAPDQPMILMTHYPPFTSEGKPSAYSELVAKMKPTLCLYGHLHHRKEWDVAVNGIQDEVDYRLVAADFIEMIPQRIWTVE